MSVRDGGECNKGSAVMSGGGGACLGSGGVSERDCWEGLLRGDSERDSSHKQV